jgi:hypothetical protein
MTSKSIIWTGTLRRSHPKGTWKRTIEVEAMEAGKTWSEVKRLAVDRTQWRRFTMPYAPEGATGIKKKKSISHVA